MKKRERDLKHVIEERWKGFVGEVIREREKEVCNKKETVR